MKKRPPTGDPPQGPPLTAKGAIGLVLLGLGLIAAGIRMQLRGVVQAGTDLRTLQPTVRTGPYVAFIGVVLVVFAWAMWRNRGK